MSTKDDLTLYHEAIMEQIEQRPMSAEMTNGDMRVVFERAWQQVEEARDKRHNDWLREHGFGDLASDTREPT